MQYRREIDGLRAVAVLPVIAFHAGFSGFSGGYVGVDIFFVISGFLITTILIEEIAEGRYSILGFYERRARRILPALFFVMLACLPFAWAWLPPRELVDFSESLIAVALFASNILFWKEAEYFDPTAELKPMLHTWSLAVEEQFYIIFPVALFLLWRLGRRNVMILLGLGFLGSLALSHWAAFAKPTGNFYLLPTRAWELLMGSACAFALQGRGTLLLTGARAQGASAAGLLMILVSILAFDDGTPFPSLYALLPTGGAALIILAAGPGTLVHRLLAHPAPVGIGLLSYSLYLWHQPVFAFIRHRTLEEPGHLTMLFLCVVVGLLGWFSWAFVERPFRQRQRMGRKTIFGASLAGTLAVLAVGAGGIATEGLPNRPIVTDLAHLDYQYDNKALQLATWDILKARTGDPDYKVEDNAVDRTAWFDPGDPRPNLLIVGNSHGKDIYNLLHASAVARTRFEVARFGTQIAGIGDDLHGAPNYRDAEIVILATRYSKADIAALDGVVARLREDGKRVVLVRNIFEFPTYDGKTLADIPIQHQLRFEPVLNPNLQAEIEREHYAVFAAGETNENVGLANAEIDRIAGADPGIVVLDRMDYVCEGDAKRCHVIDGNLNKYFYDYGHHTLTGATVFGARVDALGWLDPIGAF